MQYKELLQMELNKNSRFWFIIDKGVVILYDANFSTSLN